MTNKEFEYEKRRLEIRNKKIAQQQELEELRNKYKKKKLSMSKFVLLVVLLFCFEIAIFAEAYMWYYADSAALYSLVGIPIALMPVVIAYFSKSKAENTSGGIVHDVAIKLNETTYSDNSVG